ncbi:MULTISPECIES: hypothetical protein [Butyricimonas]|jgi:hypothetical protein|uniref:ATP-binding protein n=1 Tax=Butyricimonas hominis TaxID=2763032 RepID=A0ABR7D6H4_9BACT|nr:MULTISPECIES: hypothetical protein [Butyricimonas]MBC5623551.1 hypothetical protein [Butyricimonas hominis]
MHINRNINIQDEKLSNGLQEVLVIMDQIQNSTDTKHIIDFSHTTFVSPTFVLPLMLFVKSSDKEIHFMNITPYMNLLHFGDGFSPDQIRKTEFTARMEEYTRKTYIPIINFPATDSHEDDKNNILSTIEFIITKQLNLTPNIITGLKYMIGEIVDNITEHSHSERGYIFAQAYPTKKYLDICIADSGITLLGSYQKNNEEEIASDLEAIQAANRGISTKNLPNAENRGYGIITSRRMLTDGLNGQYIMISGSAMYARDRNLDQFIVLPDKIYWKGTIIALRIPYINRKFQYINYIE